MTKHRWQTYGDRYPESGPDDEVFLFGAKGLGEYHNGPLCLDCGKGVCIHCCPSVMDEECPAHHDGEACDGQL